MVWYVASFKVLTQRRISSALDSEDISIPKEDRKMSWYLMSVIKSLPLVGENLV